MVLFFFFFDEVAVAAGAPLVVVVAPCAFHSFADYGGSASSTSFVHSTTDSSADVLVESLECDGACERDAASLAAPEKF